MSDDGISLTSVSHPSRRSLIGLLASLPIVGRVLTAARAREIDPISIEAVTIDFPTYAQVGEIVTCENGHPICEFVETVAYGQMQDVAHQLGGWRQGVPEVGQLPLPACDRCGAQFTDGMRYHFADGWRGNRDRGLRVAG